MDNFTGFFRLVQGDLNGKQITINGYLQLDNENEVFESPDWLDREVTTDYRYLNSNLSKSPYKYW